MQDLFELTPELLLEQSQEMLALCSAYENLFGNITTDLNGINSGWSDLLSNNFSGKISNAQKAFSGTLCMLRNSAESVRLVAESAQEMDAGWASRIGGTAGMAQYAGVMNPISGDENVVKNMVDIGSYSEKLSQAGEAGHAEYALLCQLWQEADRSTENPTARAETFLALLRNNLPDNDPLKNISASQLRVSASDSGLSAIAIQDGENAIVVFAGTDFSKYNGDIGADAQIILGQEPVQAFQAKKLIDDLSKDCSNIVVTGHSLGGYLATTATLDNDRIFQCIVFDAPRRRDALGYSLLYPDRVAKVTTYETKDSFVSTPILGIMGVGDVKPRLEVDTKDNPGNHGIKQICDALGGKEKIAETWTQSGD